MIDSGERTLNFRALLDPNFTELTSTNSVPVIVTDPPPASAPVLGLTAVTSGGSFAENTVTVPASSFAVASRDPLGLKATDGPAGWPPDATPPSSNGDPGMGASTPVPCSTESTMRFSVPRPPRIASVVPLG